MLEIFHEAGAPEEILYLNKPHLGTDVLVGIVEHRRNEIISLGGQVILIPSLRYIYRRFPCSGGLKLITASV